LVQSVGVYDTVCGWVQCVGVRVLTVCGCAYSVWVWVCLQCVGVYDTYSVWVGTGCSCLQCVGVGVLTTVCGCV